MDSALDWLDSLKRRLNLTFLSGNILASDFSVRITREELIKSSESLHYGILHPSNSEIGDLSHNPEICFLPSRSP